MASSVAAKCGSLVTGRWEIASAKGVVCIRFFAVGSGRLSITAILHLSTLNFISSVLLACQVKKSTFVNIFLFFLS
jgi:hypothetical protein